VTVSVQPEGSSVAETHVSVLLFLGERVFKLRKPLRFDFADFSTPSARAEDCRREVELNGRLAPDVYLGVAEVVLGGRVLEHCVVMRRLPAERSLAHLARCEPETVWDVELAKVALTLADFHARADRSEEISSAASIEVVARQFEANVKETARFVGRVLDAASHRDVVDGVRHFLAGRAPLFSSRISAGQVCDGHGDLQADDIYCLEDGPRILDCLEFDDLLRYGDVAADLAFLAMDLERLGSPSAAVGVVRYYEAAAATTLPASLLHFYIALRAYVRVKVACLRLEQGDPGAGGEAASLLEMARHHLAQGRVRLVLVGGLPGSGKSTLAAALGHALGATVLRSDELRRDTAGPDEEDGAATFGRGRYTAERTRVLYDRLIGAAREHLGLGHSVILDASWIDLTHRGWARALATECSADLTELHCTAPAPVTEARIAQRLGEATDPSEATVDVARSMARIEAPWPSATAIDTSRAADMAQEQALQVIGVR